MIIFIDESGIHKQEGQSSTALVYVKVEHVEKLNEAVLKSEKKLKIAPFHWKEHGWKVRQAFLESIIQDDFQVKVFIFNNPFTQEKLENAWRYLITDKFITKIIIDGAKHQRNILRLKKVLRDSGISAKKIRMGNDRSFPCLRIADLFAGLTRSYFNDPKNKLSEKLYNLAKIKIATQMGGQAF